MRWSADVRNWPLFRSTSAVLMLSGAVTLGPMLLAGFVMLLARSDVTQDADRNAINIARAAGQDIARNLELYDLQLRTIVRQMQDPSVQALPPDLRRRVLFSGVTHDAHVGFINVLNEHGDVVADSASAVPRGGNWITRDYFQVQRSNSKDTPFVGKPFGRAGEALSMIPLSRRLTHSDGSFAGVVVGSARLDYFAELFRGFAIGRHGTIILLRDNGMILQRVPAAPTEIGHIPRLNLLQEAMGTGPAGMADPVDLQQRRFVLYHLQGMPLTVAVGLAPADIYTAWNRRAASILSAIAALGLLNAILLWRLGQAMIRHRTDEQELKNREALLRDQGRELRELAEAHQATAKAKQQEHRERVHRVDEVTHDLRTQLHGLLAHTALISQTGPLTPPQADHVASVADSARHLHDLSERFLQDARGGGATLILDSTDIRDLVEQCRRMVALPAEDKGLQLLFSAAPELPERVVTDGRRLRAVLTNLLDNAVRYTDKGSVALHVSLDTVGLRCVITDTGCGLSDAQRQRLTDRDSDTEAPLGARHGRGLSIIRRNTKILGGSIRCLQNLPHGSIICLDVPVTPALAANPHGVTDHNQVCCVLVVDDSEIGRKATADTLRAAGCLVVEETSGEAAVRQTRDNSFDAVLLDMCLGTMSGPETAHQIRQIAGQRGQVPIIVLSATPRQDGLGAWQQAGISDYLEKANDLAELTSVLRRAIASPPVGVPREPAADAPAGRPDKKHLHMLRHELLALCALLNIPSPGADGAILAGAIHTAGGDARQLGLAALASACRRYEQATRAATDGSAAREGVLQAVNEALAELG